MIRVLGPRYKSNFGPKIKLVSSLIELLSEWPWQQHPLYLVCMEQCELTYCMLYKNWYCKQSMIKQKSKKSINVISPCVSIQDIISMHNTKSTDTSNIYCPHISPIPKGLTFHIHIFTEVCIVQFVHCVRRTLPVQTHVALYCPYFTLHYAYKMIESNPGLVND